MIRQVYLDGRFAAPGTENAELANLNAQVEAERFDGVGNDTIDSAVDMVLSSCGGG